MPVFAASQKVPNVTTGPSGGPMPWVDPWKWNSAQAAGLAGQILHTALQQSRGSMGLGDKI